MSDQVRKVLQATVVERLIGLASGSDWMPGGSYFLGFTDQVRVLCGVFRPVGSSPRYDTLDVISRQGLHIFRHLMVAVAPDNGIDVHMGGKLVCQFLAVTRQDIHNAAWHVRGV